MAFPLPDGSLFGLLSPEQAAAYLGVSRRELARLVSEEGLPWVRIGKRRKYRREDIESWVESRVCLSSSSPQGERSTSAASPPTPSVSLGPQGLEILSELRRKRSDSTPKRSSDAPLPHVVPLPLRKDRR